MPRVDFYRLTRDPAPRVVPLLAERVLGLGQRLLVVAEDAGLHGAIGDALWGGKAHSFLANGPADGPGAAADPILIGTTLDPAPANGARMIARRRGVARCGAGLRTLLPAVRRQPHRRGACDMARAGRECRSGASFLETGGRALGRGALVRHAQGRRCRIQGLRTPLAFCPHPL
jgi:DNA polymerase IIIc chi subunit